MKKRIVSFLVVAMMMLSIQVSAADMAAYGTPRASDYLSDYTVVLSAKGSGKMSVSMAVNGVGIQDKIGVMYIDIDQKVDGVWSAYDTLYASDHPEFYDYNSRDYVGSTSFTGTPGVTYRVTLTVYARTGSGSDTGTVTSYAILCK